MNMEPRFNAELAAESLEHRLFIALAGGTLCWSLGLPASSGFTPSRQIPAFLGVVLAAPLLQGLE